DVPPVGAVVPGAEPEARGRGGDGQPQLPQGCPRGGGDRGGRSQRLVPAAVLAGPEPDREAVAPGQGAAARRAGRHRGGTGGRRRRRPGRRHARRVRQLPPLLRLPSPRAPFTQAALVERDVPILQASPDLSPESFGVPGFFNHAASITSTWL